ncbi:MAG: GNAT family N-acetyltransferase [Lachnospiraceae bacterium]|nr:GNAT family N-acetyltransferase [Lachnospiraceae bacterium]
MLSYLYYTENVRKAGNMETERLLIDEIKESDKGDYFCNITHDKKVLETFICPYTETMEELDFTKYVGSKVMFAIRLKDTGKMIGIILHFGDTEESCEIGYAIGSEYWNKGYVTEAAERFMKYCFEEMGIQKVYASYFTGNEGSKRVMEKCGMIYDHFAEKELTYLDKERDLTYYVKRR